MNASVPGKMYQYEKVPNCMYWDNSVGTMLKHQFADKMLNEKRLAVDNSQLCWSFITRKLCKGSEKLQKLCKSLSLEE